MYSHNTYNHRSCYGRLFQHFFIEGFTIVQNSTFEYAYLFTASKGNKLNLLRIEQQNKLSIFATFNEMIDLFNSVHVCWRRTKD